MVFNFSDLNLAKFTGNKANESSFIPHYLPFLMSKFMHTCMYMCAVYSCSIHFISSTQALMQSLHQLGVNFPLFSASHINFPPPTYLPSYTKPIYYDCIIINDFITSACQ